MQILDEVCEKGVIERRFNLTANGEIVPGIHWLPEAVTAPHPRCSSVTGEPSTSEFPMSLVWLESSCGTEGMGWSRSMLPDTAIG